MDYSVTARIINAMREDFCMILNPDHIMDSLIQACLLTDRDYEDIMHAMPIEHNKRRKVIVSQVLDIIITVDPKFHPIETFVKVLNDARHPTLAENLEKMIKSSMSMILKTPCKVTVSPELQEYSNQCLKYVNGVSNFLPTPPGNDTSFLCLNQWAQIRVGMKDGLARKDPNKLESMFQKTFTSIGESDHSDYLKLKMLPLNAWAYWEKGEKGEAKGVFESTMTQLFSQFSPSQETCDFLVNIANFYLTLTSQDFKADEIAGFRVKATGLLEMAQQHGDVAKDKGELDSTHERILKLNYAGSLLNFKPSDVYSGEAISNTAAVDQEVSQENLEKAKKLLNPKAEIWQDGIENKYRLSHYVHLAVLHYLKKDRNRAIHWLDEAESLVRDLPSAYQKEGTNIIKWKSTLVSRRCSIM